MGRCWACRERVFATEVVVLEDRAVKGENGKPLRRIVHRGGCEDRARVFLSPAIEGSTSE